MVVRVPARLASSCVVERGHVQRPNSLPEEGVPFPQRVIAAKGARDMWQDVHRRAGLSTET